MDRTTLAANLKPLVKVGLIAVNPSEFDRRRKMVSITDEGLRKFEEALPLWTGSQEVFEQNFGVDEAAGLRKLLEAVLHSGFDPWAEKENPPQRRSQD